MMMPQRNQADQIKSRNKRLKLAFNFAFNVANRCRLQAGDANQQSAYVINLLRHLKTAILCSVMSTPHPLSSHLSDKGARVSLDDPSVHDAIL